VKNWQLVKKKKIFFCLETVLRAFFISLSVSITYTKADKKSARILKELTKQKIFYFDFFSSKTMIIIFYEFRNRYST